MIHFMYKKNKKAIFFMVDALFAGLLLVGALLFILSHKTLESRPEQKMFLSSDLMSSLSEIYIYEINTSFVLIEINNGNITNTNLSIMDQAARYWALNEPDKAQILIGELINNTGIFKKGMSIYMSNDLMYFKNSSAKKNLVTSSRMISGVEQGKPITGASGSAYLKRIRNKRTYAYAYFGGFTGQGNITRFLDLGDLTVLEMSLDLDVAIGANFTFNINNAVCNDSSTGSKYFIGSVGNMSADSWNVSGCKNLLINGQNNFTLQFADPNVAYVSGGYIRIVYQTDKFLEGTAENYSDYFLPGINGVINIYDAFSVPGDLNNLTLYLHYNINSSTNNTFYVTIGNSTIFLDNHTIGDANVTLRDINLTALDYIALSNTTIPIRISFENLTFQTVVTNGSGFGDVILTTDVSGSMDDNFSGSNGVNRSCADPLLLSGTTKKIAVARCLDIDFTHNILLNTTQNNVGLVAYDTTTYSTLNLTNNETALDKEINTYVKHGSTCISCGVADGFYLLMQPLINKSWNYLQNSQFVAPSASWYLASYDVSNWSNGTASFGYNVAGAVTTLIPNYSLYYVNLWEFFNISFNDTVGAPNDFTSGKLNTTQNATHITYGLNASGYDGWDWKGGVYGGVSTNVSFNNITAYSGNKKLTINVTGVSSRQTGDGSYGIQFNITSAMYQIIQYGGTAIVSVRWNWTGCAACNSNSDWAAVKIRLTNSSGSTVYFGSDNDPGDGTDAIYADDKKPTGASHGFFSQDISNYITGSGYYYLDFGGKLSRDSATKFGTFYFDDVQINISGNVLGNTYYRKTFWVNTTTNITNAVAYIASNNNALVYLNGNLIDNDTTTHSSNYWNRFVNIPIINFQTGNNTLAVQLINNDSSSGFFDLDLRANIDNRQKALVIMSDGDANQCLTSWSGSSSSSGCSDCFGNSCCVNSTTGQLTAKCVGAGYGAGTDDRNASAQLINISCYLHQKYNIALFSVAFGSGVTTNGAKTLNLSAACDNVTHFYSSSNVSGLSTIYQSIASTILSGFFAKNSQTLVFSGGYFSSSILYPDSKISYNYTPSVIPAQTGEIELVLESPKFQNCTPQIYIPPGIRISDAKITSYSGEHWTDYVSINGYEAYNLSRYDSAYGRLGDPFLVYIPPQYLVNGYNNFTLRTGDDPVANMNCSKNNSFIYTILVNNSIPRKSVASKKEGCKWSVEFDDGEISNFSIPGSYAGSKTCSYTSYAAITYDSDDAYDSSTYMLLNSLDFEPNNKVNINLNIADLEVIVTVVNSVPYMWGPSIMRTEVWD